MESLAAHVPELRDGRGWVIGLIALVFFMAATGVLLLVDRLAPGWTGLGQITAILLGFMWAGQFFWCRKAYLQRWAERAYRNAFGRHVLVGMPVIFAAIAHNAYLPGERVATGWAALLLIVTGVYFFVTGFALWIRAVLSFGSDNLAMLYIYFPEEGKMVTSSIYTLVRHPVYSGVIRVGLALWLRLAEEPELIERFGEGYAAYRREVPAFWPGLKNAGKFLRFLLHGEK